MGTKQRALWAWGVLLVIGVAAAVHAAAEAVVTADGEAAIDAGGPVEARQRAIEAACAAAVARVAKTRAGGDNAFAASVQGGSHAFVRHYKMLSETREGDRYRVRIECAVAFDALEAMPGAWPPAPEETGGRQGPLVTVNGALETVTLAVKGVQPLARFVRFRSALAAMPGVEAVQTAEVSGVEATLQVTVRGGAGALVAALRGQRLDDVEVQVLDTVHGRIMLELTGGHLP